MHSSSMVKIPPAGALRVWRLTFSLQLPWFPEGLFPSWSDSFFIVTATAETCHPCSHDDQGDNKSPRIQLLGTDPQTHSLSETSVHCKGEPSVKVITTSIPLDNARFFLHFTTDISKQHLPLYLNKHIKVVSSASVETFCSCKSACCGSLLRPCTVQEHVTLNTNQQRNLVKHQWSGSSFFLVSQTEAQAILLKPSIDPLMPARYSPSNTHRDTHLL